jgi:LSD1 subclass zinc finger protein
MPDPIVCPHCHEPLDIPAEYHGRQVRCAACQTIFLAVSADHTPTVPPLPGRRPSDDQPPWRESRPTRRPRPHDEDDDRPPHRSNLGVIGLMLFTVLVVGGCCGGLNLVGYIQTNPHLTPYTSEKGKFKVDLPDDSPTEGPIAGGEGMGADQGWQVTAGRPSANERYTVRTYPLKAEWRKMAAEDALIKVVEAELTALGAGPEVQKAVTTHAGFPARDSLARKGNGLSREDTVLRCVLAGDRVYAVAVQSPNAEPRFWWIRQFFLSFDITDPAAKPPTKGKEE